MTGDEWQAKADREWLAACRVPLSREEALQRLRELRDDASDQEYDHQEADQLLLRVIGDEAITRAWLALPKWFA